MRNHFNTGSCCTVRIPFAAPGEQDLAMYLATMFDPNTLKIYFFLALLRRDRYLSLKS